MTDKTKSEPWIDTYNKEIAKAKASIKSAKAHLAQIARHGSTRVQGQCKVCKRNTLLCTCKQEASK